MTATTLLGDCREVLRTLPDASVQMCVTSPPYWRLRRYTDDPREIGQEATPAAYVAALVEVFREVRRVLRDDGTLWLNLGDTYSGNRETGRGVPPPKNLLGLPWRVAFALQDDGWILRNDIIWHKPNAMPEGGAAVDRCARDHEYVFLFSKKSDYFVDMSAIATPVTKGAAGSTFTQGKTGAIGQGRVSQRPREEKGMRHPRTVWSIATQPLSDEHYAPMPQALAERCIRAGSRVGDTVLDPFGGSGTTGRAALKLGRSAVLIELGAAYLDLQERRTDGVQKEMFV